MANLLARTACVVSTVWMLASPAYAATITITSGSSSAIPDDDGAAGLDLQWDLGFLSGDGLGLITDITVELNFTHTWIGDLSASLSYNGSTLVMMGQPGGGNSPSPGGCCGYGSNLTNSQLSFHDSYLGDPEFLGSTGDLGTGPFLLYPNPDNFTSTFSAFSGFFGLDPTTLGLWTLNVTDWSTADAGTLNSWRVIIETQAAPVPEPATLLLLGTGLGAVAARRRLKKRA